MKTRRSRRDAKKGIITKVSNYKKKFHRNATGADYLDRLLGEEGIKTDVKVNVPPTVFLYAGGAIFLSIVGAVLVAKAIKK